MGTHGRQGFRRLMMGSVAEWVVRASATPVLLVRHADAAAARGAPHDPAAAS
jgi:nucleotide-binding universal stress UspA family protein